MFPESVTKVAAQGQAISWAEPFSGRRKRHHGSNCTMCPKRSESRGDAPIDKPKIYNAVSDDKRTMLIVVDVPDWTQSVYKLVKLVRTQGFGGVVVVDRAVKCGGGKVEDVKDNVISACQPHLAFTYQVAKPDMVLLCGSRSTKAFLGHTVMVLKNPGSWQVLIEDGKKVPVVCIPSTVDIALNYIYRREAKAAARFLNHETWRELEHDWKGTVKVIEDEADLPAFQQWVDDCSWLAFDVETTGKLFTKEFNIITISFARANSKVAWVVHPIAMSIPAVHECVKDVLTNPLIGKVGQNVKYDIHSCSQYYGERPEGIIGDTRLMYKLINAEGAADLESIAATIGIGAHKKEADDEIKKAAKQLRAKAKEAAGRTLKRHEFDAMSFAYGQIDYEILLRYCALDTFVTAKIFAHYEKVIDQHEFLGETFSRTVHPASRAFCDIERTGMVVDLSNVDVAKQYIKGEMDKVEARIRAHDIDPDKPATIRAFFDREGLKSPWVTEKTGLAATDAKALKKMRSQHTIISELLEWRKLSKLLSSYLESLPFYVRDDGRVHPSILLDGARSGRLSCTDPAMQTIPSHGGQEAKLVKNCFVVPKGYTLLQLDFKTLEVYVTAAWAEDKKMIDALLSGADFHTNTAALIGPYAWGMSSEEVLEEIKRDLAGPEGKSAKRNMAKRTTFGVLYGMGPESLAEEVNASVDMAKSMIKGFFRGYEDTARKMAWAQDFVKKNGYIEIPWDGAPSRIRPLPYVGYPDSKRQGGALRASTNSPIQGWAADFCTMSAVKLSHVLLHDFNNRARIVMTVHDSILIEAEDSIAKEVARTAAEIMTSWPCGPLKLQVDVEAGKAWGSLEKLKL